MRSFPHEIREERNAIELEMRYYQTKIDMPILVHRTPVVGIITMLVTRKMGHVESGYVNPGPGVNSIKASEFIMQCLPLLTCLFRGNSIESAQFSTCFLPQFWNFHVTWDPVQ